MELLFLARCLLWRQTGDEGLQLRQPPFQFVNFSGLQIFGLVRITLAGARNGFRHRAVGGRRILSLNEFEGIKRWSHGPVGVLRYFHYRLHILEGTLLASPSRGDHHLAQDVERKVGIRRLGVFDDDLRQDEAGNIFAARRIDNTDIVAILHHLRHLVEVHVLAVGGVVEAPVFVLLDEDGLWFHTGLHNTS